MRGSIGRWGRAALELLLPSARAHACTDSFCEVSGSRHRCCKFCPGGEKVCSSYVNGGSCVGVFCPN